MAGSLKEMIYTSDTGATWLVRVDESNGEAFGFDDFTGVETITNQGVPRGAEMRYVTWQADQNNLSRKFWVGKPDHFSFVNGGEVTVATLNGNAAVALVGQLKSATGEKRRLPLVSTAGEDTGLNDGDIS